MRLDRPPVFMISPASRKNGAAISGKLSAPAIRFCAMICASIMLSWYMSAAPQTRSANAIGIPSAIAPRSENRKTAMVTAIPSPPTVARRVRCSVPREFGLRLVLGLAHLDQIALGEPSRHRLPQVAEQERGG